MKKVFIGIDVSAETLDICIKKGEQLEAHVINNKVTTIRKFFKTVIKQHEKMVVAMENTGEYNNYLYEVLSTFEQIEVYVCTPIHIKRSLGLIRGKNDKIDDKRIARFIEKNQSELIPWIADSEDIKNIKILFSERAFLVKSNRRIKQKIKSLESYKKSKFSTKIIKNYRKNIKANENQIKELEKMIRDIVKQNEDLKEKVKYAQSVPGIGEISTWQLLCKTNGFTQYTNPRKLACCIGVVPFNQSSGTSLKTRDRVSNMADKKLKTTIHMAAMRAVRMPNDLQHYYVRKVAEGKNKMSVLNAVRNKLIHIVLACVKNKSFYQNRLVLS